MELKVNIFNSFGSFAANGSIGNDFRVEKIEPYWSEYEAIVLDFDGVNSMTHSFVNALVGNLVEAHPDDYKRRLKFKNCSPLVKDFIKSALSFAASRIAQRDVV